MNNSLVFLRRTHIRRFIVSITILEHGSKIIDTFFGTRVDILIKFLFDTSHVHRMLDNSEVILSNRVLLAIT